MQFLAIGGEKGIRTLDTFNSIHAFQAGAFNLSAISPKLNCYLKYFFKINALIIKTKYLKFPLNDL